MRFIHQLQDWPGFRWDSAEIVGILGAWQVLRDMIAEGR